MSRPRLVVIGANGKRNRRLQAAFGDAVLALEPAAAQRAVAACVSGKRVLLLARWCPHKIEHALRRAGAGVVVSHASCDREINALVAGLLAGEETGPAAEEAGRARGHGHSRSHGHRRHKA